MAAVLVVSWTGVILAQAGAFSLTNLLLILGLVLLAGLLGWLARRPGGLQRPAGAIPRCRWEHPALALVLLLAAGLFARPTDRYVLWGDSAIYPNTGAPLARTGRLTYDYPPLAGLTPTEQQLFYVPGSQVAIIPIQGLQGVVYGAYYLTNAEATQITSSRPPLFIVWLAIFYLLFGPANIFWATPLFGVLGVAATYLVGSRLFGMRAGLLAAALLTLTFPQLHFARTSYAEVPAQVFVLFSLYGLCSYLVAPRSRYLLLATACLGAGLMTRLDTLVLLAPAALFFGTLLARRDRKGSLLFAVLATLALTGWALQALVLSPHYFLMSWQIYSTLTFQILQSWPLWAAVGVGGGALLGILLWRYGDRLVAPARQLAGHPLGRGLFAFGLGGLTFWAYYIRPLFPHIVYYAGQFYNTRNHEILAKVGLHLTPVLIWAGVLGLILLFWRGLKAETFLFVTFFLCFAPLFLWKYTSATVYPVALRRFVPEVIPALVLLASYAVTRFPTWPWRPGQFLWQRLGPLVLAGALFLSQLSVSAPYLLYQEGVGSTQLTAELARQFSNDARIVFEPLGERSFVGWFANPLWSLHDKHALLLNPGPVDVALLEGVFHKWLAAGKPVYYISMSNPPPLYLSRMNLTRVARFTWDSSIIGQSADLFPPFIWRFAIPIWVYRVSPAGD